MKTLPTKHRLISAHAWAKFWKKSSGSDIRSRARKKPDRRYDYQASN